MVAGGLKVEGVYAAQFLSNLDQYAEGIIVLDGGRIHGGDLDHVYIGKYSRVDNEVLATVDVANYSGRFSSVFGQLAKYRLTLNGTIRKPQDITVCGKVEGHPHLEIRINLHKVSQLVRS